MVRIPKAGRWKGALVCFRLAWSGVVVRALEAWGGDLLFVSIFAWDYVRVVVSE